MGLVLLMIIRLIFMVMFFRFIFRALSLRNSKEETNLQSVDNTQQNPLSDRNLDDKVVEDVVDPVCGQLIKKDNAYIILKDNVTHYFCSWECRQKYVSDMKRQLKISEQAT